MAVVTFEPGSPLSAPRHRAARPTPWLAVAAGLITLQLAVRWWVLHHGYFYWDDLILMGEAGRLPAWSPQLLWQGHDGHFMPLGFLTAWLLTWAAPMHWGAAATSLLIFQLAASLAALRMILVLVHTVRGTGAGPWRTRSWVIAPALACYLFSPLTLPAFAWWSAGLNALPLQFALAWVTADVLLLAQTGRRRYLWSPILVTAVALLFFEKSVVVPCAAFALAAVTLYTAGQSRPVRFLWQRTAPLWLAHGALLSCWLGLYAGAVGLSPRQTQAGAISTLIQRAIGEGLVPALFGGPWVWTRIQPSPPLATPPQRAALLCAGIAIAATVAGAVRCRRQMVIVSVVAGYTAIALIPVAVARSGPHTAPELMQSLRYFADVAVLLAAAVALLALLPAGPRRIMPPVCALTTILVASSLVTTITFTRSWAAGPQQEYLRNLQAELANQPSSGSPLLDQEVPWEVLSPAAYPRNLASRVMAATPAGRSAFASSTPQLRMITNEGRIAGAQLWWNRAIEPGPVPGCGHRLSDREPVLLPLNGPMLERDWTAQLNYSANRDGVIYLAFPTGSPVKVPVRAGLSTVFVRLAGGGRTLRATPRTPGLTLCVGVGPVGVTYIPQR